MLELRALTKRFGSHCVLNALNLHFDAGSITAVLGPNGSGKTTLMKTIVGAVHPSDGEILLHGHVIIRARTHAPKLQSADYRHRIGYMPQIARFQDNMSARELLRLVRQLRGTHNNTREEELCMMLQLHEHLDKPLKTLSGGTRQKVSAVIACMFRPDLLLLDEPTAGLDPIAASVFKDFLFQERNAGTTILLTSHVMSEVQELADTIVFLLDGVCIFHGKRDSLLHQTGETQLERALATLLNKQSQQQHNRVVVPQGTVRQDVVRQDVVRQDIVAQSVVAQNQHSRVV